MGFLVFSFLMSGSVAAVFISLLLSGVLDGVARMFYIYFGWESSRSLPVEQDATLTR